METAAVMSRPDEINAAETARRARRARVPDLNWVRKTRAKRRSANGD
jgi:hypothetical protein